MNVKRKLNLLLLAAIAAMLTIASPASASLGLTSFDGEALQQNGTPQTQAGSHPHYASTSFELTQLTGTDGLRYATEDLKDVVVDLPAGLLGNPNGIPTCSEGLLAGGEEATSTAFRDACPLESEVGVIEVRRNGDWANFVGGPTIYAGVYNMKPPPGKAALFGFNVTGAMYHFAGALHRDDSVPGAYRVRVTSLNTPQTLPLAGAAVTVFGVPADPSHDTDRGYGPHTLPLSVDLPCFIPQALPSCSNPSTQAGDPRIFFNLPTSCAGPVQTDITVTGWQGGSGSSSFLSHDNSIPPVPTGNDGCEALEFSPSLQARPTTNVADSPTGLDVDLHIPQPPASSSLEGKPHLCNDGAWSGEPTGFAYQWLRNGVPIPGAVSNSYVAGPADAGALVQCEVTATNTAPGSSHATSFPFPVQPAPTDPPVPGAVTIGGSVNSSSGGTLTCNAGSWGASPDFAYQWLKNGSPVSGQTASTYVVNAAEVPLTVQCEVIATNPAGTVIAFSPTKVSSPAPSPALPSPTAIPQAYIPASELPLATAHLKDTTVLLPEGMTVNPSGANGLGACSAAQFDLHGQQAANCPDAAKVGSVEVETPLLDHPVQGAVYVATPYENPFNSLLAIYIAIDDPQSGTVVKVAGKVIPDPKTGRLTTTVTENPQVPFEDFHLHFKAGPHASLKTPPACGAYSTTSSLTSWAGQEAAPHDDYLIAKGPSGSCPTSEAALPHAPSFDAGTLSPIAGHYSPFVVHLRREDGSQRFGALTLNPPQGLVGKLAGTPPCPDSALAAAAAKSGRAEEASPSCPPASRVGTVHVGAGAGPSPYHATGIAYLAGPYKGAPLSLAIVTPATAGPFDLGTVVVKTALYVDPKSAQLRAVSDPIPSILQGIPLDVRTIDVAMDKPNFTLNPTSCDPMAVSGQLLSTLGQPASLLSRFQLAECTRLGFKPKMTLSLKGGTKRGKFPALTATLEPRSGDANLASISVALPHSEFLEQGHIRTVCTRVQFAADQCPAGAIYGQATVFTPLLDYPLSGPIYLRSSDNPLPDLVPDLRGPAYQPLRLESAGRTDSIHGGIRNSFDFVPDAPFSKLVVQLPGGAKGLLVNSRDICTHPQSATVKYTAHNGATLTAHPALKAQCPKQAKRKKQKRHRKGR